MTIGSPRRNSPKNRVSPGTRIESTRPEGISSSRSQTQPSRAPSMMLTTSSRFSSEKVNCRSIRIPPICSPSMPHFMPPARQKCAGLDAPFACTDFFGFPYDRTEAPVCGADHQKRRRPMQQNFASGDAYEKDISPIRRIKKKVYVRFYVIGYGLIPVDESGTILFWAQDSPGRCYFHS